MLKIDPRIRFQPFDTSTTRPTYLAELPNGQQLQISFELYQLIELLDGTRSETEVLSALTQRWRQKVSSEQLQRIIAEKITPAGLMAGETKPRVASTSMLALRLKFSLFSARQLRPLTNILQHLFQPVAAVLALALAGFAHFQTYAILSDEFSHFSLGQWPAQAYPQIFLLVLIAIFFHELGHFSACRRYGREPQALGVGIYLFYPVFFADVSAAWSLPRRQRAVVDVGGMYFQFIFGSVLYIGYLLTYNSCFLWAIIASNVSCISQLNPMIKWDGYWLLSDLFGLPNLHQRTAEYLRLIFRRLLARFTPLRSSPSAPAFLQLLPYARLVLVIYALFSAIFFGYFGWMLLWFGPGFLLSFPALLEEAWGQMVQLGLQGDWLGIIDQLLRLLFPTLLLGGLVFLVVQSLRGMVDRIRRRVYFPRKANPESRSTLQQ